MSLFTRIRRSIRRWFGGSAGTEEPFDFASYEFPRLDIDQVAASLNLIEQAEENGRAEIPRSESTALDAPQEKTLQYVKGEIAKISARYEGALTALNGRIRDLDVPERLRRIAAVPSEFQHEADASRARALHETSKAREAWVGAQREYDEFRARHGIEREPRYPESHFNLAAVLVALWVLEGLVNAAFFAQGAKAGYVGGAFYALLLALVDILVVFNLGRAIAWLVARSWLYRTAAVSALVVFVAWAGGFNLLVGHVREALQLDPSTAMTAARESFLGDPLGLSRADSWLLVAIGLGLSLLAMLDGTGWDDKYPGYGALHRRLVEAREDLEHWKSSWREEAIGARQNALERIDALLREVKRDAVALARTIDTKALLLKNIRSFASHYQDSCNALIRLYRDNNERHRESEPPNYFSAPWELKIPDELSDSTETDRHRLETARAAEGKSEEAAEAARKVIEDAYSDFVNRIETETAG